MIKPKGHKVLVLADPIQRQTESGIILQEDEKLQRSGVQRGLLLDYGANAWKAYREFDENGKEVNGQPWAKPGDYILFARFAGRFIDDPFDPREKTDSHYLIMNDDDILAVLSEGKQVLPPNKDRETIVSQRIKV